MPSPDLYNILGVPKDASVAAIKAAFRRLAKDRHPDHGGDPEQFRWLKLAYDVLSNPEQRRHYDQTGETPDEKAAQAAEELRFRILAGEFLVNLISHAPAPEFTDIAELARKSIIQQIQQVDGQIAALSAVAARIAETQRRLLSPAGEKILQEILGDRLRDLEATITTLKGQRERWIRLQATLKDYGYEVFVESVP